MRDLFDGHGFNWAARIFYERGIMAITKIELGAMASKIDLSKEVGKTDDVGATSTVEKGAHVRETQATRIEFSENIKVFYAEALEAVKGAPDVRMDRIAELKAAIADGSYKIDSLKLADKMLRTHLTEQ